MYRVNTFGMHLVSFFALWKCEGLIKSVRVLPYSEKRDVSCLVVKSDMIVDFFIQSLCCEGSLMT